MRSSCLMSINEPQSMIAECYKIFRTNLNYTNIDSKNKVLMFTSSVAEEGKSTSAVNAAISFAMSGRKVLLLECDLRKPRMHEILSISQTPGLVNILAGKKTFDEAVQTISEVERLDIITSGPLPPDPAEMLASQAFDKLISEVREAYDIVLIDTPPVLSVTDAAVLCKLVDGIVLIIAANKTRKDIIKKAKKALEKVGGHILGALMTKADIKRRSYYYYYSKDKKREKRGLWENSNPEAIPGGSLKS